MFPNPVHCTEPQAAVQAQRDGTRDNGLEHNIRVPCADTASVRNVQIVPMSPSRPGKLLVSQSTVDTF